MSIISARTVLPTNPIVLSYKALRKAVGYLAIALPGLLVVPSVFLHNPPFLQRSISAYYYTDLRDVFVGCLCALAMFMFCTRGYDWRDEYAGITSALALLGVALLPMSSRDIKDILPCSTEPLFPLLHVACAIFLFLVLGYFCLFLFRMTSGNPTPQKLQRNAIYLWCGCIIYASMMMEGLLALGRSFTPGLQSYWSNGHHELICEVVCLWAFGYAWLIKGEAFYKDVPPELKPKYVTDNLGSI